MKGLVSFRTRSQTWTVQFEYWTKFWVRYMPENYVITGASHTSLWITLIIVPSDFIWSVMKTNHKEWYLNFRSSIRIYCSNGIDYAANTLHLFSYPACLNHCRQCFPFEIHMMIFECLVNLDIFLVLRWWKQREYLNIFFYMKISLWKSMSFMSLTSWQLSAIDGHQSHNTCLWYYGTILTWNISK